MQQRWHFLRRTVAKSRTCIVKRKTFALRLRRCSWLRRQHDGRTHPNTVKGGVEAIVVYEALLGHGGSRKLMTTWRTKPPPTGKMRALRIRSQLGLTQGIGSEKPEG